MTGNKPEIQFSSWPLPPSIVIPGLARRAGSPVRCNSCLGVCEPCGRKKMLSQTCARGKEFCGLISWVWQPCFSSSRSCRMSAGNGLKWNYISKWELYLQLTLLAVVSVGISIRAGFLMTIVTLHGLDALLSDKNPVHSSFPPKWFHYLAVMSVLTVIRVCVENIVDYLSYR